MQSINGLYITIITAKTISDCFLEHSAGYLYQLIRPYAITFSGSNNSNFPLNPVAKALIKSFSRSLFEGSFRKTFDSKHFKNI